MQGRVAVVAVCVAITLGACTDHVKENLRASYEKDLARWNAVDKTDVRAFFGLNHISPTPDQHEREQGREVCLSATAQHRVVSQNNISDHVSYLACPPFHPPVEEVGSRLDGRLGS